jgi:hypothetical protein
MAVLKLKESKAQSLADEFTAKVMTEVYGERYTKLGNLEDDHELSEVWDELNEGFYSTIYYNI